MQSIVRSCSCAAPACAGRQRTRVDHRAFTLTELLVVLAITVIVLGLLTVGIQQAREAAWRAQCASNLHQIGVGFQSYSDMYGSFPSGGWGWAWVGDPDHGTGRRQPGGWLYQLLPFVGEAPMHDLGEGNPTEAAALQLVGSRVGIFNCPSRRDGGPYPNLRSPYHFSDGLDGLYHFGAITFQAGEVIRADYAANAGSQPWDENNPGPVSLAAGYAPSWFQQDTASVYNGVIFLLSQIAPTGINRGTSNVYLVGERYLDPASYTTGSDIADNETMFCGFDNDNCRCTAQPPMRDTTGVSNSLIFGSAHPAGFNMCYCDGSVRFIEYSIDPEVHMLAGMRN